MIVSDSGGDPEREREILEHLSQPARRRRHPLDAQPQPGADRASPQLPMPFVLVDQKVEDIDADFVASDNVLASAMLTEHVIRFGHRRIAHIAGRAGLWTAEQRKQGFVDTMRAAGIEVDESLIVDGDYTGEVAYAQAMRLLTRADRPTAIIAANNVMALGALQAMNDLGFDCPNEVSLTSIDDVPWGNVIRPRITMVVQPVDEMARIATEFLLERIGSRGGADPAARAHPDPEARRRAVGRRAEAVGGRVERHTRHSPTRSSLRRQGSWLQRRRTGEQDPCLRRGDTEDGEGGVVSLKPRRSRRPLP